MIVTFVLATALAVDFGTETGKVRPELHSSGFGPTICSSTSEGTVTLLAGKSADGGKRGLLVTDYMGEGLDLSVRVAGVPAGAKVRATVLDHERLLEPCAAEFEDGVLKLRKNRPESTAFCVTFERQAE